jgi:hypothetical protein
MIPVNQFVSEILRQYPSMCLSGHPHITNMSKQSKEQPPTDTKYPDASANDRSTTAPQPPGTTPLAQKISAPYSHSRFGTLFTRRLPDYSGPHDVGVLDVEFGIPTQRIGSFQHKKLKSDAQAGVEIDSVLFTLFDPCKVEEKAEKGACGSPGE